MNKILIRILQIVLILFGLLIFYQILRKVFGGSWSTEGIMITLIMFNTSLIFTLVVIVVQLKVGHNFLKKQFSSLAIDFKALSKDFNKLSNNFNVLSGYNL